MFGNPAHTTGMKLKAGTLCLSLLAVLVLLLTACGGSSSQSSQSGKKVLTLAAQASAFTDQGFNPYASTPNIGINGFVYETLEFCNVNDNTYHPLLALSHQFNSDYTQVTFHLRQGVKWNDGQPFSADDVVFTFNALKQYPAADLNGDWGYLKSVVAPDANTVVMTFQKPFPGALYYIAGLTVIIPKHIFESVGDVTKYYNSKPVGTGPFVVAKYTPDLLVLDKNPNYYQANLVKVDEIKEPRYKDNDAFKLVMPTGQVDWSGYYADNLQQNFVAKDPQHFHYFMAPVDEFGIFIDVHDPLLSDVAVRKAISLAIDRQAAAQQGESGLVPPVPQSGLLPTPGNQQYVLPEYANLPTTPNPSQAQQLLKSAGYTLGSDGIFTKNGQRLSFELISVAEYSDWNKWAQVVQSNLKAAGIDIHIKLMPEAQYLTFRAGAKPYQLMISGVGGGPTPYFIYNGTLSSQSIPPNGRNSSYWKDAQTDKLLQQFASTMDPTAQKQAIQSLERIMVEQVPWIPVVAGARWFEYNTMRFTGWPDQQNQYAVGSPYSYPDNEIIVMHLQPVS
ncbi:ABC transporter substrate-binding protein [Thermogemmatispora sp.]|uniref:ABC transporter substrate-binding protein n=2 Tax=Thermogemmatispora sp. TaxID=1968838 RepID=UPI002ACBDFD6|nr:ABC transporter substrate-binding protein [Thermogemmatispora sp.]